LLIKIPLSKSFYTLNKINTFQLIAGLETFLRARRNRKVPQGKMAGCHFSKKGGLE
jgi:hypothetical protein